MLAPLFWPEYKLTQARGTLPGHVRKKTYGNDSASSGFDNEALYGGGLSLVDGAIFASSFVIKSSYNKFRGTYWRGRWRVVGVGLLVLRMRMKKGCWNGSCTISLYTLQDGRVEVNFWSGVNITNRQTQINSYSVYGRLHQKKEGLRWSEKAALIHNSFRTSVLDSS